MAKRSLNSIWQNVEKCYQGYKNDKTSLNEAEDKLKELMAKDDVQTIINDLGRVLLSEFDTFEQAEVRLAFAGDDPKFVRPTIYDAKEKVMSVDPFRVLEFYDQCKLYSEDPLSLGGGDFDAYRKNAFMAELSKLPTKAMLFLKILQQSAITDGLTHIGLSEVPQGILDDVAYYQTLLWALAQLEKKMYAMNGIHLRTEYTLVWHEAEWISGT
jgi:hypothetical protein